MSSNAMAAEKSAATTDDAGDQPTCPNGHVFCPVENPGARADALGCHDCAVIDTVGR